MKAKPYARSAREVEAEIPQRYPILMIDRVLEESPGRCVTLKNITIDECFINGHFPGRPIMPGSLLMESMAQAGHFIGHPPSEDGRPLVAVTEAFLLASDVKFHLPVVPGDQVVITARFLSKAKDTIRFRSDAYVGSELVATGTFLALVRLAGGGK
jgi:3-hydroxyacyl-[acyl-carrier-protein] dehydratase